MGEQFATLTHLSRYDLHDPILSTIEINMIWIILQVDDVVKVDIESGKIIDVLKFEAGKLVMITKGRNTGRVGTIVHVERHPGSFDIVIVRDSTGHSFSTRKENVFIIGHDSTPAVSLPKGAGIKMTILEERDLIIKKRKTSEE